MMYNVYKKEGGIFWHVSSHSQLVDAKASALRLDAEAYVEVGQTEEGEPILELDAAKFEILNEEQVNPERIKPEPIPTAAEIVSMKMAEYRKFGNALVEQMIDENVLLGISEADKTADVLAATEKLERTLKNGSLKEAIKAVRAIPVESRDPVFLSEARLLATINKIEEELGLELSLEL